MKTQTVNNIFIVLVIYKNNKVYFNNIMYDYHLNQNLIKSYSSPICILDIQKKVKIKTKKFIQLYYPNQYLNCYHIII